VVFSGTQQGGWAGIPATGRRVSVRIACLYEFDEDRLVCERVWFDLATILRQLGVLTP
jgi:predicted ester cyclase